MAPSLSTPTPRCEALPALSLQDPQFLATLETVAQHAREALPLANGRIEKAIQIVLSGGVTLQPDGHAVVASQSQPQTGYSVNGTCPCEDARRGRWLV